MLRKAFTLLLALLLLASCTDGDRMRRDLAQLEARNQNDSLLTDSSLALTLADYFDAHGSQSERLEAHYLLARTWADLGQGPRALDAFHTAAEQADTTRLDSISCHFLSRIYGQMGGLLYDHQLPYNALEAYTKAEAYATACNEQAAAAIIHEQTASCHYLLGDNRHAAHAMEEAYMRLLHIGDTLSANVCLGPLAYTVMQSHDYDRAKQYLDLYEHHSKIAKKGHVQDQRWKLLYCYKGFYYLGVGLTDSALCYFNRAYKECTDQRDLLLACRGLYLGFGQLSQSDSVAKYAKLYAQTNDSTFLRSTTSSLLSINHLYNYNSMRNKAERHAADARSANLRSAIISLVLLLVILLTASGYVMLSSRNRQMLQRMNAKYVTDMALYAKAKAELKSISEGSMEQRRQLEEEIKKLKDSLEHAQVLKMADSQWEGIEQSFDIPIVASLHQKAAQGKAAEQSDWKKLFRFLTDSMPWFLTFLQENDKQIDHSDTLICLLTKLRFLSSERCVLLNISSSNLSHRRKRLNKKLFGSDGSATDFDERIHSLTFL